MPGPGDVFANRLFFFKLRLPVLMLPGDVFANRIPNPVLQQLEDVKSNYSVNDTLVPVSTYN